MAAGTTPASALFTVAHFPSLPTYGYLVPKIGGLNGPGQPFNAEDPVAVTLTDGRRIFVFDKVRTAMRCLEKMRVSKQSFLVASDDIVVWALSWTKLICAEATLTFQRLMTSYVGSYAFGFTRFTHRNLSSVQTLGEALQSVGFAMGGTALQNNFDLETAGVHATVVDYRYKANWSAIEPGSLLDDTSDTQLEYSWREPLTRGRALAEEGGSSGSGGGSAPAP